MPAPADNAQTMHGEESLSYTPEIVPPIVAPIAYGCDGIYASQPLPTHRNMKQAQPDKLRTYPLYSEKQYDVLQFHASVHQIDKNDDMYASSMEEDDDGNVDNVHEHLQEEQLNEKAITPSIVNDVSVIRHSFP
mmetsp:Transcript_53689/g.89067  ORF Transcript_53689/g.89067 Transcript_53689/m.89067 type:complete len:134 (-) Transcript_53689:99-500(-)